MPRVLVLGDVMRDIVVHPEGAMRRGSDIAATIEVLPGGSAANQAAWLAALGVPVALVARVGAEDRDMLVVQFAGQGIEALLAADPQAQTGSLVDLVGADGERSFFTDRAANARLCVDDLPARLPENTGIVLVSGYALFSASGREAVGHVIGLAKEAGVEVAVDAASAGFLSDLGAAGFLETCRGAGMLFANQEEAAVLAGTDDEPAQLTALSGHFPLVVLKRGAGGALARQSGAAVEAPAKPANAVDTTGAGDAFAAGFLARRLQGGPLKDCLAAANTAAARAISHLGGRPEIVREDRC